ncbi:MAG: NAD-dependent epimerase/dehydratase family protein [Candidatus Dadabacteria bacterium]|nr:NAD-dependent epimerase/dehydratase family protein [Candidatus Dadabacteria bacterium]MCZ6684891.1 NAD-dependent epimerase/dehydratase family protein [Candidatus Dadabacteria bacterium]
MRVLVTGVSGFIGSSLSEKLLDEGFQVIGVDSFFDYYPRKIKENNLYDLLKQPDFEFVESDILGIDWDKIISQVDGVFHQAALAGVRASWGQKFDQYVQNNILGTQRLLEACKNKRVEKFIYASSSSVYGDTDELPIHENSTTNPVSPYGVSKLAAEHLASLYFKSYGVPAVSLRYFTVYGPRQRPDMAFHKFITAVINGDKIEVYGTGEQTRDFTFIDDVVQGNIQAFRNARAGEVYNIGGGSRIKLIDTIRIIEEITGREANLVYTEPQRGDAKHTFSDVTKAKADFDYSPQVDVKSGLEKHYEWLKKNLEIYK